MKKIRKKFLKITCNFRMHAIIFSLIFHVFSSIIQIMNSVRPINLSLKYEAAKM